MYGTSIFLHLWDKYGVGGGGELKCPTMKYPKTKRLGGCPGKVSGHKDKCSLVLVGPEADELNLSIWTKEAANGTPSARRDLQESVSQWKLEIWLHPLCHSELEAGFERLDLDTSLLPTFVWGRVLSFIWGPVYCPLLRFLSFQLEKVPVQEIVFRHSQVLIKTLEAMSRTFFL